MSLASEIKLLSPFVALLGSLATGGDLSLRGVKVTADRPDGSEDLCGPPARGDEARWSLSTLPPASRDDSVETGKSPPADLVAELDRLPEHAMTVSIRQPGHAVYLRHDDVEGFGERASVTLNSPAVGDPSGVVLAWESYDPETLQVAVGQLRLSGGEAEPTPRLSMAEAPRIVARHDAHRHRCQAHADGRGGLTVVCALSRPAFVLVAGNASDDAPVEGALSADAAVPFVRLHLPCQRAIESRVFGYFDGEQSAVLFLAEASRADGEDDWQLSLTESAQPASPRRFLRSHFFPWHHRPPIPRFGQGK